MSTKWIDYVEEPMKYQALRPHFSSVVGGDGVGGMVGWVVGWDGCDGVDGGGVVGVLGWWDGVGDGGVGVQGGDGGVWSVVV